MRLTKQVICSRKSKSTAMAAYREKIFTAGMSVRAPETVFSPTELITCWCCTLFFFSFFFCQAQCCGAFNCVTYIQYNNMLTHSFILHSIYKKNKKYVYVYWLNQPLQFDMFMTYIYECSTIIPYIIMCECVCVCMNVCVCVRACVRYAALPWSRVNLWDLGIVQAIHSRPLILPTWGSSRIFFFTSKFSKHFPNFKTISQTTMFCPIWTLEFEVKWILQFPFIIDRLVSILIFFDFLIFKSPSADYLLTLL